MGGEGIINKYKNGDDIKNEIKNKIKIYSLTYSFTHSYIHNYIHSFNKHSTFFSFLIIIHTS